jgi:hypothetical protein
MVGAHRERARATARVITITKRQRKQALPASQESRQAAALAAAVPSSKRNTKSGATRRSARLALAKVAAPVESVSDMAPITPLASETLLALITPDAAGDASAAHQPTDDFAPNEEFAAESASQSTATDDWPQDFAETADLEPTITRRLKVRVRRKRLTSPGQSGVRRMRSLDTTPLPNVGPDDVADSPDFANDQPPEERAEEAESASPAWLKDSGAPAGASTPAARRRARESHDSAAHSSSRKLPTLSVMMALESHSGALVSEPDSPRDPGATAPLTPPPSDPSADCPDTRPTRAVTSVLAVEPDIDLTITATTDRAPLTGDAMLLSDLRALYTAPPFDSPSASRSRLRPAWAARMLAKRALWRHADHSAAIRPDSDHVIATAPTSASPAVATANSTEPVLARRLPITRRLAEELSAVAPLIRRAPRLIRKFGEEMARRLAPERIKSALHVQPFASATRAPAPKPQQDQDDAPITLLAWVGGAQATLGVAGALVAVLALLYSSAGPRAFQVCAWAMSFTLIASVGAALAHLAWRWGYVRLAAVELVLSQITLLGWALALLGARPALMTLAPFVVALALRALGRPAAIMAGLTTLALYGATLVVVLSGVWTAPVILTDPLAMILDCALVVIGMAQLVPPLAALYPSGAQARAHTRAVERAARYAEAELVALRAQTQDDAATIYQALANARQGVPTEGLQARGALSPLADEASAIAVQLVELWEEREARKRLESATRRLLRNVERAWLGLSWQWPEPSGVILDDLVALLRSQPSSQSHLPNEAPSVGQVIAPHLYRNWQPGSASPSTPSTPILTASQYAQASQSQPQPPSQPLLPQLSLWPDRSQPSEPFATAPLTNQPTNNPSASSGTWLNYSQPSQPSGIWSSLWPSDPQPTPPGTDPLALPPSPPVPRWRSAAENGWLVE